MRKFLLIANVEMNAVFIMTHNSSGTLEENFEWSFIKDEICV